MNKFEQQYYEFEERWEDGALGVHNEARVKQTAQLIPTDVKSLLDAGCGNGILCNYLYETSNIKITGLDRSKSALKYLKTEKKVGSISNIPFPNNSFDCVSSLQVLEHLNHDEYSQALSELCRVSKKYVIISVPYNERIDDNVTQCPSCKTTFNFDLHLRSFDKSKIVHLFDNYNFKCINTINISLNFEFWGYRFFLRVIEFLFGKQDIGFYSPICPLCGYKNDGFMRLGLVRKKKKKLDIKVPNKLKLIIKKIVKSIWPMVGDNYWIVSLYEK